MGKLKVRPDFECLVLASEMLAGAGNDADTGLLHAGLSIELLEVDRLCRETEGQLVSRQVIAMIIYQWKKEHPEERAYRK